MTSGVKPWQILSGFFISGLLLALPGALLPVWDYHIQPNFGIAGNLFLAIGIGTVAGGALGGKLDSRFSPGKVLSGGCWLAALSFLLLSIAGPPAPYWLQLLALFIAGASAGLVNTAMLEAITAWYERDPAGTTLLAGTFLGAGSFVTAILISQALNTRNASRWLAGMALLPALAGVLFTRLRISTVKAGARSRVQALEELRSPIGVFFALLLFFQFGGEWALAGWLPVLFIDRLGISPSTGLLLLALYWFALTGGRLVASLLLRRISHWRLLAGSAFCALFGCVVLYAASNMFGVLCGLVLTGAGFSAIYPLSAERIGQRFSYYHPAYFNGIFAFALIGGMLAPWSLGQFAAGETLQIVPLAAMISSCAVFGLILLIWLGNKVSGS